MTYTVAAAEKAGFRPLVPGMSLKAGDKVYRNNRGKSILLAVIGEESLNTGMNICAAHIDSPRLDLKPNPLYEDSGNCLPEDPLLRRHQEVPVDHRAPGPARRDL